MLSFNDLKNKIDSDNINMSKYSIIACFARINSNGAFISKFKEKNVVLVASSTLVLKNKIDIDTLDNNIINYSQIGVNVNRKYLLVNVGLFNHSNIIGTTSENVFKLDLNFITLIQILTKRHDYDKVPQPNKNIIELHQKEKIIIQLTEYITNKYTHGIELTEYDLIKEYEVVFIIQDISWNNLVYILNSTGITVFGGFSQNRHILSTVQSNLTTFINLCFGFKNLSDIVYHGNIKSKEFIKLNKKIDNNYITLKQINKDLLTQVIENYKEKYGDYESGIKDNNQLFDDYLYLHYNEIVKYISQLYYLIWTIQYKVEIGKNIQAKLLNMSPEEISKDTTLIINLQKVLLELNELKTSYNNKFRELQLANKVETIKFEDGVCLVYPPIKENIEKMFTVISLEEFNNQYGNYLTNLNKEKKINNNKTKDKILVKLKGINSQIKREFSTFSSLNKPKKLVDPIAIVNDSSPYLEYLTNEIKLAEIDPKSTQINLENKWVYKVLDNIKQDEEKDNKDKVIVQYQQNNILKKAFQSFDLRSNKITKKLPNLHSYLNHTHVIIAYATLDIYTHFLGFTAVTFKIAEEILKEIYLSEVRKKKAKNLDFKTFKLNLSITQADRFNLGLVFVEIFSSKPTPLYKREYRSIEDIEDSEISDENMAILVKNIDFLDLNTTKKIISPYSLPMLAEPLPWSDREFGGYYINSQFKESVITGKTHSHKVESKVNLYNSINKLNKNKFKINSNLLLFLLGEGQEILKNYLKNLTNKSDLLLNVTTLKLAKIYNLLKIPFYIPTHADWRGRLYTVCYYLTYQGNELSLALLNLFEGQALNQKGLEFLKIYGANNFNDKGINKKSIDQKIQWVNYNLDKIINLDIEFILKAESPILFSAFCLAYRDFHLNPQAKLYLPVFLDATCSGIQHLSALVLDAKAGEYVNLVPQNNSTDVSDIYSEMLEPINNSIRDLANLDFKYKKFESVNLLRKNIKSSIMTQVYNVSLMGIKEQLLNSFEKIEVPALSSSKLAEGNNLIDNYIIKEKDIKQTSGLSLLPNIELSKETMKAPVSSLYEPLLLESKGDIKVVKKVNKKVKVKYYYEYLVPSIEGSFIRFKENEVLKLAQVIDNEIFKKFPSLEKIFDYLIEVAKLCLNCNVPLNWFTPAGVEITQAYNKTNKVKASITLGTKSKSVVFRQMTDSIDKRKQIQAIIPNIVHSLDSAHLMLILENAQSLGIKDVLTIHDCFGAHPNDMESLKRIVILEFVKIYSDYDFLTKFHNRIIQSIEDNGLKIEKDEEGTSYVIPKRSKKYNIPSLPIKGQLNIKLALYSKNLIV